MIMNNDKTKLLVMDVDGTLTDGKINCSVDGELFKSFSVKDGYAIANILPKYGIIPVIITGRTSGIVDYRAKELKINELHQGVDDKLSVLEQIIGKYQCKWENVAYIGDDLNDIECIQKVGVSGCPADSVNEVLVCVDYICKNVGGNGAVREFIEEIVK